MWYNTNGIKEKDKYRRTIGIDPDSEFEVVTYIGKYGPLVQLKDPNNISSKYAPLKDIKMEDFNKKFNWLNAWLDVHFKRICKILLPYLFFLIVFYLFLIFIKKRPQLKKLIYYKNSFNVNFIFFTSLFGCLMWFLKFPIYRYGYSYLITVLVILFSNILYKEIIFFNFKNQKKIILTIVILSISTLFIKQSVRIAKNYNNNYNNYPWPKYYDYSMDNNNINTTSKLINGKLIYKSSTYCMYSKAPCTNEEIDIKISEKNNYLIFN